jgi:lysophospholipase L1-like esterase
MDDRMMTYVRRIVGFFSLKFAVTAICRGAVVLSLASVVAMPVSATAQEPEAAPATMVPTNPALPTIWIVGDSTASFHTDEMHEGEAAAQGWGPYFSPYFDLSKVNVMNVARGGRSTRTYRSEGTWDKVLAEVKKNDIVLIQMGQNDVFAINDDSRARGTIPGTGDESQEIDNMLTKKHETVHTFGWYLRQYIRETKAKGAVPIVLSLTPRDKWIGGRLERGTPGYREWGATVAQQEHTDFVDMTEIIAEVYDRMEPANVAALYHAKEPVHADYAGAALNAKLTVSGLKALRDAPVTNYLSAKGKAVPAASQTERLTSDDH